MAAAFATVVTSARGRVLQDSSASSLFATVLRAKAVLIVEYLSSALSNRRKNQRRLVLRTRRCVGGSDGLCLDGRLLRIGARNSLLSSLFFLMVLCKIILLQRHAAMQEPAGGDDGTCNCAASFWGVGCELSGSEPEPGSFWDVSNGNRAVPQVR